GRDASLQEAACALRKEGVSNGSSTDHAVCGEEGDTARGQIHDLVLVHVTAETGSMAGLGKAYDLHDGSSEGQAPASSASCAWPMASRRRGSSFLQFTMTFCEWTASTASSGTTKSPAFST